jgi:hypothetical protein
VLERRERKGESRESRRVGKEGECWRVREEEKAGKSRSVEKEGECWREGRSAKNGIDAEKKARMESSSLQKPK